MGVLSATVYTTRDQAGTPRTEAWLTLEFTGNYVQGGQAFDLSPYFKRLDYVVAQPVSGCELRSLLSGAQPASGAFWNSGARVDVMPVVDDYANPVSARFQIWGTPSALSGFGIREIVSGVAAAISGIRFTARVLGA